MKKLLKVTITLAILLLFAACSNDYNTFNEKSIDYNSAFANKIGYIDAETKNYVQIDQDQLFKYWRKNFDLNESLEFMTVKLIKAKVDKGEEQYYILNSTSLNGLIKISSKILISGNGFTLEGEECKCESTDCTFGCEVLSMCTCSSCSRPGQCKKTHTVKSELSKASF